MAEHEDECKAPPLSAGRCRILIVEDNSDVSEVLQETLILDGHLVEVAPDGETALELAARLNPHIALVDLGLPRIDGFEVARRLRAAFGDAMVLVALTGYNTPEARQRSVQAGFDAHLVKPVDPVALERILTDACQRASR